MAARRLRHHRPRGEPGRRHGGGLHRPRPALRLEGLRGGARRPCSPRRPPAHRTGPRRHRLPRLVRHRRAGREDHARPHLCRAARRHASPAHTRHQGPRPAVRPPAVGGAQEPTQRATLVGQLCTPKDVFARDVPVPSLQPGDVVAFAMAGAYAWNISHHDFLMHPKPEFHYLDH
ncbi:hypothetical protein [Actinomadura keratinilytica]|uniref:hypothetical protein n=1 Tax=Actinomadura keratinilytica TaxID=547461 RepID=UPI00361C3952